MSKTIQQLHSQKRAEERYQISNFNPNLALNEILSDKCVQIEENFDKYSRKFLIKYFNKYVIVVTDFQVNFIKTCLPFENQFKFLEKLINKLNSAKNIIYKV